MSPVARRGAVLAAGALGTVGSLLLAGVGNSGAPHPPAAYWPFVPPLSSIRVGGGPALTLSRVGLLLLVLGWGTLGVLVQQRAVRARSLLVITGLWALPLLSSPPLFSDDAYDYAASGALQTHGLDPYLVGPHSLGASRVAGVVSPAWSRTPTPYGPGFLLITRAISAVAGAHDIVAVTLLRVLAVIAVAVLAWVSVLLARSLGRRSTPVLWAVVANPLVLTAYVGGAHNDAMMMAMVVAAFLLHRRGHTVAALALTVLAAELKVIAVIATAVLLADLLRGRDRPGRTLPAVRRAALLSVTAAGGFGLMTSALGLPLGRGLGGGWGWVGALDVPGRVQTSVTPVDAVFDLLHPPLRVTLPRNHRPMLAFDRQPLLLDLRAVALSAAAVGCAALVLRVPAPGRGTRRRAGAAHGRPARDRSVAVVPAVVAHPARDRRRAAGAHHRRRAQRRPALGLQPRRAHALGRPTPRSRTGHRRPADHHHRRGGRRRPHCHPDWVPATAANGRASTAADRDGRRGASRAGPGGARHHAVAPSQRRRKAACGSCCVHAPTARAGCCGRATGVVVAAGAPARTGAHPLRTCPEGAVRDVALVLATLLAWR